MRLLIYTLRKCEQAQDMVEYALLAGFVSVGIAAGFPSASASLGKIASKTASLLAVAAGASATVACPVA